MTVDTDRASDLLFGRYQAMRIYMAIGSLAKDEFTTRQVEVLSEVDKSAVSKELSRLVELGVVERKSRRGDYVRISEGSFWQAVQLLASHLTD